MATNEMGSIGPYDSDDQSNSIDEVFSTQQRTQTTKKNLDSLEKATKINVNFAKDHTLNKDSQCIDDSSTNLQENLLTKN
jgi:hypothetical protein